MSLLKIALMGNPTLAHPAAEIPDPSAAPIRLLAANMVETMLDADGVGLAAPQVHVPLRLIVFQAPGEDDETEEGDPAVAPLTVLINPEIEVLGPETEGAWEGCLSLPGLRGFVVRPAHIRYRGLDLEGKPIAREASGLHARVVQHETDHLDGILYPQRIRDLRQFIFESEAKHWAAQGQSPS
jgi:peptide deformylase